MLLHSLKILIPSFIICIGSMFFSYGNMQEPIDRIEQIIQKGDSLGLKDQMLFLQENITKAHLKNQGIDSLRLTVALGNALFTVGDYLGAANKMEVCKKNIEKLLSKSKLKDGKADSVLQELHINCLIELGQDYVFLEDLDRGTKEYMKILDLYGKDTTSLAAARVYNAIGASIANSGHIEEALIYYDKAKRISSIYHPKNYLLRSIILSNIGGCYYSMEKPETALSFFLEAHSYLSKVKLKRRIQDIYMTLSLALAYQGVGSNELADKYYKNLFRLLKAGGGGGKYGHLEIYAVVNYMDFLLSQGKRKEAIEVGLRLAEKHQSSKNTMHQVLLLKISNIYADMGNIASAYTYLHEAYILSQAIHKKEDQGQLKYLQQQYDTYKQEQKKLLEQKEYALVQSTLEKRNYQIGFLALAVLFIVIVCIFLYMRILRQCRVNNLLKNRMNAVFTSSKNHKIEMNQEMEQKDKKLISVTLNSMKTKQMIEDANMKLKQFKLLFKLQGSAKLLIMDVEQTLEQLQSSTQWDEFDVYYNNVNREFIKNLEENYPDLNLSEKRLCALLYLNLSSKEIANITQKTTGSLATAKTRLRKKMNIDPEIDFYDFFKNI
ncbi:MAG: tetratricopeptide repeat protein [Bacteroidales bacterium]